MPSEQAKRFFIIGTDTEIGKSTVTKYLIESLHLVGKTANGCKPIACGVDKDGVNEDVFLFETINSLSLPRNQVNPLCFALPASPNIGANHEGKEIIVEDLVKQLHYISQLPVDFLFFEGCGGLYVPINEKNSLADILCLFRIPVIFVVGIQVGCLNKAILTWQALKHCNLEIAGWIGNVISPSTPAIPDHIATLENWISAPYLGTLPYQFEFERDNSYININQLINYVPKSTTHYTFS